MESIGSVCGDGHAGALGERVIPLSKRTPCRKATWVALSLQGHSAAVIQLDSPFYSPCCPDLVEIRLTYHVESIY